MIYRFGNKKPSISKSAFIAETACIIGDVSIGEGSSVWFNSVIRGDMAEIRIGKGCSIQDHAVIHSDENEVKIGDGVIIGHGSIVHGKQIKDNALIGMNATILHGAEIGEYAIVGAGALVPPNQNIPANMVVMGIPCKEVRKTNEEDIEIIENTLRNYKKLTEEYLKMKG
ncbi:MAG: gamma carbonic anhydrase family protein [Candidatus Methanoperedens sp.]|jgi:carbonic anhydrase/acetyltransferase-like protein (isoleucine patch superfamily)|nr:gamma carbonic anhydrase family protein [Candidatus Methanoperedens sp.]